MSGAPDPVVLVLGDEELLATRAVGAVVEAARAADPQTDVRDVEAAAVNPGEIARRSSWGPSIDFIRVRATWLVGYAMDAATLPRA